MAHLRIFWKTMSLHFLKNNEFTFFYQIKIWIFIFWAFSFFKDLFFNSESDQLKELSFAKRSDVPRKSNIQ